MIKAVIFDLDGVLVESEHLHIEAEKQTLLKHGVRISSEELHRYTGTTANFMFTELIKKYKLNTTFKKMFDEKEKILFNLLRDNVKPTQGVMQLLVNLKRENIKLAIASSSHKKLINHILKQMGVTNCFDLVLSSEDVTYGKPDPEIFLKAASGLNVDPDECLVIEDSKLGVEAAKKAGMKCVGYRNPHSGDQDLSESDIVIDNFSKLNLGELLS
jgi:beta-phosphoglucomutase family hydrolase